MCTSDAWRHKDSMWVQRCGAAKSGKKELSSAFLRRAERLQDNTCNKAAEWTH